MKLVENRALEEPWHNVWRICVVTNVLLMEPNSNVILYYILIVDSERSDHFFLRRAIEHIVPQAIVESLYDCVETLAYLKNCSSMPNLILINNKMLSIDGKDTMDTIRKNETLSKIPVVVLSNRNDAFDGDDLLNKGASAFYIKPSDPKDLQNIIEEVRDKWLYEYS